MHKGSAAGNIKGKNTANIRCFIRKNIGGKTLDGLRHSPLGNTHRNGILAEIQNISTLQREGLLRGKIEGCTTGKIRMIMKEIIGVDGFPITGLGIHAVYSRTMTNGCKGISRKVQIGDGVQNKVCPSPSQSRKRPTALPGDLIKSDTCHGLKNHFLYRES